MAQFTKFGGLNGPLNERYLGVCAIYSETIVSLHSPLLALPEIIMDQPGWEMGPFCSDDEMLIPNRVVSST